MKIALAFVVAFATLSASAFAQDCRQCAGATDKTVRVNANFQVSLPVDDNVSPTELGKTLASASEPLYDIVSRQCDVLANEYKGDCHVVQLNVNTSINDRRFPQFVAPGERGAPQQRVSANASVVFEITPASPDKSPAKP